MATDPRKKWVQNRNVYVSSCNINFVFNLKVWKTGFQSADSIYLQLAVVLHNSQVFHVNSVNSGYPTLTQKAQQLNTNIFHPVGSNQQSSSPVR